MARCFASLLLIPLLALSSGCGRKDDKTPPKGPGFKGTIGVSVLTLNNPFFKIIGDTITEEAAKHGYKTVVVSGDNDVAKQQNQIKDFLVQKAVAIVLCPCDSKGIGPAILEANKAGVPVFTADIACLAPDAKIVTHIATDNLDGGHQAGHAVIEALGETGGKVAILDYKQVESCQLRVRGFKHVIDQHNKGRAAGKVVIVAELPGDGDKEKGSKAAEDILQSHQDLAAIFAINDPSALGAYSALVRAAKADQVKLIGFDGQKEGKEAIKKGQIYADPVQFPDQIGRTTADCIMKYFQGEKLPGEILIPTRLYRQADGLKDPDLK